MQSVLYAIALPSVTQVNESKTYCEQHSNATYWSSPDNPYMWHFTH